MHTRRRGIALMLVMLTLAGVFALAMHAATDASAHQVEVRSIIDRLRDERDARAAAVLALRGLQLVPQDALAQDPATSLGQDPAATDEDEGPELPAIVRALLEESDALDDIDAGVKELEDQENQRERRIRETSGIGDRDSTAYGIRSLKNVTLPQRPVPVVIAGKTYTLTMRDALSGLSINAASPDQLTDFFIANEIETLRAMSIADQIVDWRDADAVPRGRGAEQDWYTQHNVTVRNAPFASLDELLFLPAMDSDIFNRVHRDLSLDDQISVHAGSASRAVLLALPGMTDGFADRIMLARAEGIYSADWLKREIPAGNDELREQLRGPINNYIELSIQRTDPPGPTYRCIAAFHRNRLASLGMKLD